MSSFSIRERPEASHREGPPEDGVLGADPGSRARRAERRGLDSWQGRTELLFVKSTRREPTSLPATVLSLHYSISQLRGGSQLRFPLRFYHCITLYHNYEEGANFASRFGFIFSLGYITATRRERTSLPATVLFLH